MILVVVIVAAAWIVVAGVLLVTAAKQLQDARSTASRAVDGIQPATLLSSDVAGPLDTAAADFRGAHAKLSNPVLLPIKVLPVFGRQLRSIEASASAAGDVTKVAATALRRTRSVAARPVPDGPARIAVIDELAAAVHDARAGMAHLDLGPDRALIGPVRTVHRDLVKKVSDARDGLHRAEDALGATKTLLAGPSRYLVIAANNAEMRAGSGMWLTGGILTTQNGRLSLGEMRPIYDIADPSEGVGIADKDLRADWGWMHPDREWRSLMASPRFLASAPVASAMWRATGHPAVDGILVVDSVGLGDLVAATGGSVVVDGRTYGRDGIIKELMHDQYVRFAPAGQTNRREALSAVANAVFDKLDAGRWKADDLAHGLTDAVRGRHLFVWAADPSAQRGWSGAGTSGALRTSSLAVSLLNRGGNKLDWFLRSSATVTTERAGKDIVVTAKVRLTNTVGDGEPTYVQGPFPGVGTVAGEYKGVVAINVPGFARDIHLDGVPTEIRGDDGPTKLMAGTLLLPRGASATVTIRFRVPVGSSIVVEPSARFPAVTWRFGAKVWTDERARTMTL